MKAGKKSFLRRLLRGLVSGVVPADGGYVFDLHGRWRYEVRRTPSEQTALPSWMHSAERRTPEQETASQVPAFLPRGGRSSP